MKSKSQALNTNAPAAVRTILAKVSIPARTAVPSSHGTAICGNAGGAITMAPQALIRAMTHAQAAEESSRMTATAATAAITRTSTRDGLARTVEKK